MEQVTSALTQIKEINNFYNLSSERIEKLEIEITEAKVCTPVIGMFSAGKSRLLNTLLGYKRKILKEDITPATAVPTEIVYTDDEDKVIMFENRDTFKEISIEEYRNFELGKNKLSKTRIELRNRFLEKIPDLMVVDMPGFVSGFQVHDRAIDEYRSNSLVYIIAFPTDKLLLTNSVGNILKELCLHDMPICVVITKYDKKTNGFEEKLIELKRNLTNYLGEKEVIYCITSSYDNNVEQFKDFLIEIQKKSRVLLSNKFKKLALPIVETTENYLKTIINGNSLSESELADKKENLENKAKVINDKVINKRDSFIKEVDQCIIEIKADIQQALETEETVLVNMVLNEQKIEEQLKTIVRNAITESVKKRFVPRLEKYIHDVNKIIDSERLGDLGPISLFFDIDSIKNGILSSVLACIASILLGPILGPILGTLYYLWNKNALREKAKKEIEGQLRNNVYPEIIKEVEEKLRMAIKERIELVNNAIQDEAKTQMEILQKAMDDLNRDIKNEELSKEKQISIAQDYLKRIEEIKHELQ